MTRDSAIGAAVGGYAVLAPVLVAVFTVMLDMPKLEASLRGMERIARFAGSGDSAPAGTRLR